MANFIEKQANDFGEAHQKQIINVLINVIDEHLDTKLEKVIADENNQLANKHKQFIDSLKTKEDKKLHKNSKPQTVIFKNETEKFSYAFNQLLKEGKTILHDVDDSGQLIVKIFKFVDSKTFKFKSRYTVDLA